MAKSTVGQFIAVLRKANGMTQQEMADRLNVSNKAVSRWERDECSPDISLIPAIAEMFGITCDELLKGERTSTPISEYSSREQKTEKQIKALIARTVSGFRTMIYISLAVSVIGLVCMFGISYGIYRPVIGFSIMLLFEICAFAITVLGITRAKDVRNNELFTQISDDLSLEYEKTLGKLSFISIFTVLSSVLLSLPLIIVASDYQNSVMTFESYIISFFPVTVFILFFVYLRFNKPFSDFINGKSKTQAATSLVKNSKMTFVQTALTVSAGFLFIIAPYFDTAPYPDKIFTPSWIPAIIGLVCLAASIVCFVIFTVRNKENKTETVFSGIRNLLLIPSAFIASECHYTGWTYVGPESNISTPEPYDVWQSEYLLYAFGYAAAVIMIFSIIKIIKNNVAKK